MGGEIFIDTDILIDAFIAASVISLNGSLVTKNKKDFRFIKGLKLAIY